MRLGIGDDAKLHDGDVKSDITLYLVVQTSESDSAHAGMNTSNLQQREEMFDRSTSM
jgi:hypothetical protein